MGAVRWLWGALGVVSLLDVQAEEWLVDVASASGLQFRYENGRSGEFYFPEIMGGGVGVLDFDADGWLDIYLVQGGALGPKVSSEARKQGGRLYRNLGKSAADGALRFQDVTQASGIDARGYGIGVAVADIDNDGDEDLYLLNFGANQLWRNNGDGSFSDITARSGVAGADWSVSASFADLDGDGLEDLYVVNYVDFSFDNHKRCRTPGGGETDYCSPSAYPPSVDRLYRNLGDGRFQDVSETSGIGALKGHGLGVIAFDVNADQRIDLYVANDGSPNFLWINQGGMKFADEAMLAGVAVNSNGAPEASMGVDAADFDRNGHEDIFMTHMRNESNTLYTGIGDGWFEDRTATAGLAASSLAFTGFGTAWFDLDRDGWLDLYIANGGVMREAEPLPSERSFPYAQADQLYRHNGKAGAAAALIDVSAEAGVALKHRGVGRGVAMADFDNDGRVDLLLSEIGGPVRLLHNRTDQQAHWLGIEPMWDKQRRALQVRLLRDPEGAKLMLRSRRDGSYASSNDPRQVFGLGTESTAQTVEVLWPDGTRERFAELEVDRYHRLQRGSGKVLKADR